ncbi:MAG: DUF2339 domain-containing protein [Sphingomonadales bacterium]|nr:DUF2339 domain-containing protein [Sphingomonadales bacterium]MDE2568703.1 DUF2339 domain-containing protein [Sphingomonadales bacterium]
MPQSESLPTDEAIAAEATGPEEIVGSLRERFGEPGPESASGGAARPSPASPNYETPQPALVGQWLEAAKAWVPGGNTIVRAGLVILFVGLSFLARYAASIGLFPLELRLALVGLAGVALLVVGLRKRNERPAFARALEGTGVAVLYLTIFARSRLFDLIPFAPAFGFLILFCGLGCALALLEDLLAMAMASFVGGFAVPDRAEPSSNCTAPTTAATGSRPTSAPAVSATRQSSACSLPRSGWRCSSTARRRTPSPRAWPPRRTRT